MPESPCRRPPCRAKGNNFVTIGRWMPGWARAYLRIDMISRRYSAFTVAFLLFLPGETKQALAQNGQPNPTPTPPSSNAPPAPVLAAPANGASLVQPITLDWNAVSDPDGPIGSYTWQIATTSGFASIIASGFTNMDFD